MRNRSERWLRVVYIDTFVNTVGMEMMRIPEQND